jgi:hypothetical protein
MTTVARNGAYDAPKTFECASYLYVPSSRETCMHLIHSIENPKGRGEERTSMLLAAPNQENCRLTLMQSGSAE